MSSQKINPNDPKQQEMMLAFLEMQTHEMEARQKESENHKEIAIKQEETSCLKIETDAKVAEQSIKAQLEYEKYKLNKNADMQIAEKSIWTIGIIACAIIVCVALFTDNAKEVFQFLTYGVSALAGYFAGRYKKSKGKPDLNRSVDDDD